MSSTLELATAVLIASGAFSVGLGAWHLGVPRWFDFVGALRTGDGDTPLAPMRFGPFARSNSRAEVLGLSWVMSNAASYVLISIGVLDLLAARWISTSGGGLLALWIGGWWFVRAGSQLAVGRRRLDVAVMLGFGGIGLAHVLAALATSA